MDPEFVNKYNQVLSRLKQVENFDGSDPGKLPQFLNKIEALMPSINSFDEYYKTQLIGHIKNKCTDRARDAVFTRQMSAPAGPLNGTNHNNNNNNNNYHRAETWLKIKDQLLHNYAERESSYALIHKLRSAVLDSNIELYYQKISKLKHRLINRKLTHNDTLYSLEDIERITLQVFRDHLPEPTHSMILRRNPKSMEEAYRYIVEVQQQFYTQSGSLGLDQGATFSTSHKQTYGGLGSGVGVGMGGVGISTIGLGIGVASCSGGGGTGSGGNSFSSSYQRQMSDRGLQNKNYYNQSAPLVGAGKSNPMFKSIGGNPAFKSSFSYNGSSSSSSSSNNYFMGMDKNKSKDNSNNKNKNMKVTSGWRK